MARRSAVEERGLEGFAAGVGPIGGGEASPRSYAEDLVFIFSTPCYL